MWVWVCEAIAGDCSAGKCRNEPEEFLVVETEEMDEEVENEGVVELEKKTVLQYLSRLLGILLFELLLRAELFERRGQAGIPNDARVFNKKTRK